MLCCLMWKTTKTGQFFTSYTYTLIFKWSYFKRTTSKRHMGCFCEILGFCVYRIGQKNKIDRRSAFKITLWEPATEMNGIEVQLSGEKAHKKPLCKRKISWSTLQNLQKDSSDLSRNRSRHDFTLHNKEDKRYAGSVKAGSVLKSFWSTS